MKLKGFQKEYRGLTETEVLESRNLYGKNELEANRKKTLFGKMLHLFFEPMFLLLFFTSTIYFLLGQMQDGIIMLCFVLFVSGIDVFQEWRTDRALESLKALASSKAAVLRGEKLIEIDSEEIVVGDLLLLEEGNQIMVDGQILECYGLGVNESTLTGESALVIKQVHEDQGAFRKDMVYAGTVVISGTAVVRVSAVGKKTEYGKIGEDLVQIKEQATPLQQQTNRLIRICAWISFFFCCAVIVVTFLTSTGILKDRLIASLLSGITVAMATIPEEFPVVLTVFLAMGAWKLVRQNALIRKMPAVETLGAVSILCVDKTGTLTKNEMTIMDTYASSSEEDLIITAILASERDPFDPMEQAIIAYGQKFSMDFSNYTFVHDYAFHSENQRMGHLWKRDHLFLAVKGAYEVVASCCALDIEEEEKIKERIQSFSKQGYRVLAVASADVTEQKETLEEYRLQFLGLLAFMDPPREEVVSAIQEAKKAGVRVVMITGDAKETAEAIAEKVGISSEEVLSGEELEHFSFEKLRERVRHTSIFARVYPRHKMKIVEAFQENGEVVAMTGDGVNDAPALKKADIGIAMGKRGTDVAKEAADMILLDDNFVTILKSVENGRRIYDNIKKAMAYILVIHIPIAFASLFIPLFGLPALLLPIHIVLLELIIDPTSSIVFERQPLEKDAMNCPPRNRREALLSKEKVLFSILQGIIIFLFVFFTYFGCILFDCTTSFAMTLAFTVLILSNVLVVPTLSSSKNAFSNFIEMWKDPVISGIYVVILIGLGIVIYTPWMHQIMKTTALPISSLLLSLLLAFCATFWILLLPSTRKHI